MYERIKPHDTLPQEVDEAQYQDLSTEDKSFFQKKGEGDQNPNVADTTKVSDEDYEADYPFTGDAEPTAQTEENKSEEEPEETVVSQGTPSEPGTTYTDSDDSDDPYQDKK